MKKTITLVLILVLTVCSLVGCRRGDTPQDMATQASEVIDDMMPRHDRGMATDGNGYIGNSENGNGAMMPNG